MGGGLGQIGYNLALTCQAPLSVRGYPFSYGNLLPEGSHPDLGNVCWGGMLHALPEFEEMVYKFFIIAFSGNSSVILKHCVLTSVSSKGKCFYPSNPGPSSSLQFMMRVCYTAVQIEESSVQELPLKESAVQWCFPPVLEDRSFWNICNHEQVVQGCCLQHCL